MGKINSIVQQNKECYICGTTQNLQLHHIFFGTYRRKKSDEYGLTVWLCRDHHTGQSGVHPNRKLQEWLFIIGQTKFEELHGHKKFMEVFKKNYL
jgi:hypothetical protein